MALLDLGRGTFDRYFLLPLLLQRFLFYLSLLDHFGRNWQLFIFDIGRRKRIDYYQLDLNLRRTI
jgi:hypothetical protein